MTDIFRTILNMSITGIYISLAIIVIRFFIRKLPKQYSYILWSILGIRLICPFSFSSALSLFNLIHPESSDNRMTYIPDKIEYAAEPQVTIATPEINNAINNYLPPAEPAHSINPMQAVMLICTSVWLAGVIAMLIYTAVSYFRIHRHISSAVILRDNVYICSKIQSPFVYGILRPKIYIPEGVSDNDLRYIIAHEQTHIARCDHIIKLTAMMVLCIHWFNPMIWLSYKLMVKDMEHSCDERAVKSFDTDVRKDYANALLNMSVRHNKLYGILAFGESGIKSRIKGVLSLKKPRTAICILASAALLTAAVCLLTNSRKDTYRISDYNSFILVSSTAERQAVPEDINELITILDGISTDSKVTDTDAKSTASIRMYRSDNCRSDYSCIELLTDENGYYLSYTPKAGSTADFPFTSKEYDNAESYIYSISQYDYHAALHEFSMQAHNIFTGKITEIITNGQCVVTSDVGQFPSGKVFVRFDEPVKLGDRAQICFQGLVMETSPQKINQVYASVLTSDTTAARYVTGKNLYMAPYSSFIGDYDGRVYSITDNSFMIYGSSHELDYNMPLTQWTAFPYSHEEWKNLFETSLTETIPDIDSYEERLYMQLSNVHSLMKMDSELWLMRKHDNAVWSIYTLVPYYEYAGRELGSGFVIEKSAESEGYEVRSPYTDIYLYFENKDYSELHIRRPNSAHGYDEYIFFHPGGLNPSHSLITLQDITGDGTDDLIVMTHITDTGVVENITTVINGSTMKEILIDRVSAEIMLAEHSKVLLENEFFKEHAPYLSASRPELEDKYIYPYYPDKSVWRFSGMMYDFHDNVFSGTAFFYFVKNQSSYSAVHKARFVFVYKNGSLVPESIEIEAAAPENSINTSPEDAVQQHFRNDDSISVKSVMTGQFSSVIAWKYRYSPLKEKFNISENSDVIQAITEYTENGRNCQKLAIIECSDNSGFKVVDLLPYNPMQFTGTITEICETADNGSIQYYIVQPDNSSEQVRVYSIPMYGNYDSGDAVNTYNIGSRVIVAYNDKLEYGNNGENQIFSITAAPDEITDNSTNTAMTAYSFVSQLHIADEHGYTPSNSEEYLKISYALPSDWEKSGSTASLDGKKIFEMGVPYSENQGIDYDSFKRDDALGRDITVHEEKHGTDDDPFEYYISTSVSDYYSDDGSYDNYTYVVNRSGYNLYLHFVSDSGLEQTLITNILRSITIEPFEGNLSFDDVTAVAEFDKNSKKLNITITNNTERDVSVILYTLIVEKLSNDEYVQMEASRNAEDSIPQIVIKSGESCSRSESYDGLYNLSAGSYRTFITLYFTEFSTNLSQTKYIAFEIP